MSDAVIPKEQMSAYQRWEMASFNQRPGVAAGSAPEVTRITIEQQAQIREAARTKGHAEGYAEGRAEGLAQGRADAALEQQRLVTLAEAFGHEVARADEVIAHEVLDLTLDLCKVILKTALAIKPERVLPIVSEAIHYLPALQQPALLILHPDDATLVRERLADDLEKAGWRLVEDAQIERGGCRVETASNQIDATLPTRWQRLTAVLGKDSDWLDV